MFKRVIGVHGVPRSGTSWLAQIFNSNPEVRFKFQPLFSYAFKDFLNEESDSKEIQDFFCKIYESEDYFLNLQDKELHSNYPTFIKNESQDILVFKHVRYHHLLMRMMKEYDGLNLVLIIRNPLSVLSSWMNAPKEFKGDWNIQDEWLKANKKNQGRKEEYFGYEKWKESVDIFEEVEKHFPKRVLIVKYKDLLASPLDVVMGIHKSNFMKVDKQTIDFIKASTTRNDKDPNSVFKRKDIATDYSEQFPKNIIEYVLSDVKGTRYAKYL